MQLTKEVILAQIEVLYRLCSDENIQYIKDTCIINIIIQELQEQLQSAKSIEDLQREAFNAAKLTVRNPNFDLDEDDRLYIPVYDNYEDYINSINND